jgi:predicted Zn-dependent protease
MADLRSLLLRALLLVMPLAAMLASGAPPLAAGELPDIGSPANAMLPKSEEARIGRAIMRELRSRGSVVEDPLINEYIEAVGHRLVAHANDGEQTFEFFVVEDPSINAFALPGGFIGVHTGLIEATENESELAGVLAHEIAHVTQRHIARSIYNNSRANIITLATMLGAILVGMAADGGSDATQGAIMGAQGMMVQNRINFTRRNEYEADRVGVSIMAAAGFDPQGMPDFFATIGRRAGPFASSVPEFLRTHPVSSNRIAETRSRAASLPVADVEETTGYGLAKARIIAEGRTSPANALTYFRESAPPGDAALYGEAVVLLRLDRPAEARRIFERLIDSNQDVIAYHIGLAEAQLADDNEMTALSTYANARELFPRNVPLIISYAETLLQLDRGTMAHDMLLDLLNNTPPTPEQVRLIARAAVAAGETAEAHYYLSEYSIMIGDLVRAIGFLSRGLELPETEPIQRARFEARIDFIKEYLSEEQLREVARNDPGREPGAG